MSETAYRLILMRRALARSDRELLGRRALYESVLQRVASQLIAGDYSGEIRAADPRDATTLELLDQAHRAAQARRFAA
jgi:hypothetical protein